MKKLYYTIFRITFLLLITISCYAKKDPSVFNPFPDTIFCKANTLLLDAGAGYITYKWNTNDSVESITVQQTGWYGVLVTDANGTYNDSVFVSFLSVYIYPRDSTITAGQNVVLTIDTATKKTVPVLHVASDFNGWNPAGTDLIASINNNNYYEGYFQINAGSYQLKFTSDTDWHHTVYGMGASSGLLTTDKAAGNILFNPTVNGLYKMGVNTTTFTYDIIPVNTIGVIGDAALGWGTDLPMQLDTINRIWYGNYTFNAGSIKFRANNSWTTNYGGINTDSTLVSYGPNILIPSPGNYFVSVNLSNPIHYTYQLINLQTPLLVHPSILWSTGDTTATINVAPDVTTTYYCTKSNGIATVKDSVTLYIPSYMVGNITTSKGDFVSGVNLYLSSNTLVKTDTVISNLSGGFGLKVLTGEPYQFKMHKDNDVNKTNGVTALDLALIQSHILGKNKFNSPYKIIAADVNGDGKLTPLDLVYIKRLILGYDTTFNNTKTGEKRLWTFADPNYVFADPSSPFSYPDSAVLNITQPVFSINFLGIRLGDVNWDWDSSVQRQIPSKQVMDNGEVERNYLIKYKIPR